MAISVLTYASKTWMVTGKEKLHIQTTEMNFLRHMSGYCLRDQMHIINIKGRTGYILHQW